MTTQTEEPAIDGMAVLVDAIARGRLSVAELSGLSPEELDVLGELGAQHLDTGRDRDAVRIYGGLVALFPYAARHWRGYAIALHRIGAWEQARAAYDAALLLEPDVLEMFCYRGEVLLYLGESNAARPDLERAMESAYPEIRQRAQELLRCARELQGWTPPPRRAIAVDRSPSGFSLGDGRSLPLAESPLEESEPEVDAVDAEATQLHQQRGWEDTQIRMMVPLSRERTAQVPALEEQSKQKAALKKIGALPRLETATTGLMFAPNEGTDTALIPGRGNRATPSPLSHDGTDTALLPGRGEDDLPVEHTAISKRRLGLPLMQEEPTETYNEDPWEDDP